jgi:hypothetical protein
MLALALALGNLALSKGVGVNAIRLRDGSPIILRDGTPLLGRAA